MKLPKYLNKMTAEEQRQWFIDKMNEHYNLAEFYKKQSQSKIKMIIPENDIRPDEIILKEGV